MIFDFFLQNFQCRRHMGARKHPEALKITKNLDLYKEICIKNNFVAEINLLKVLREQEMTKICPKMAHNEPKKPKKWSQMTKNLNSLKFLRM